jgi:hypothetical protein
VRRKNTILYCSRQGFCLVPDNTRVKLDYLRDIDLPVVKKRYYEDNCVLDSVTRHVNQKGLSHNKSTDERLRPKKRQTDDETTDTGLEKDKSRRREAEAMEKEENKRSRTGNFSSTEGPQLPKASDTTSSVQTQTMDEPSSFAPLPRTLDAEQVAKFRGSGFRYKNFFPRSKPKRASEEDRVVGATSMPAAQPGSSATAEEPKK